MNGDWPRFHSIVQTYRMLIPHELHNALMVNMIAGMNSYMQRKVCKEPKPTDLDEAIRRAWEVHYTTPPPAPLAPPMAATPAYVQSVALPQSSSSMPQSQTMDLDALQRVHGQPDTALFSSLPPEYRYNTFTGQHMRQSLGPIRTPTFSALQAMPEYRGRPAERSPREQRNPAPARDGWRSS